MRSDSDRCVKTLGLIVILCSIASLRSVTSFLQHKVLTTDGWYGLKLPNHSQ